MTGAAAGLVVLALILNAAIASRPQTVDVAGTDAIVRSIEGFDPATDPSLDPERCAAQGCFVGCATPPTLGRPLLWCRDHGGSAAPPVVSGARVVLVEPAGLLGVERASGEQRWRLAVGDTDASVATVTNPLGLQGQLVLVPDGANGTLLAVRLVDGTVAWQGPPGSDGRATAVGETILVVGNDGRLWSLDGQTGQANWVVRTDAPPWRAPLVTDGGMVVTLGLRGVETWDLATGLGIWRRTLGLGRGDPSDGADPDAPFPVLGPVVVGDRIIVATAGGTVVALDEADGTNLWEVPFGKPISTPPVATDDHVLAITDNGVLHLMTVAAGDRVRAANLNGAPSDRRAMAVGRDHVYVTDRQTVRKLTIDGLLEADTFDLGRSIIGPPIVSGQTLYVTTRQALYVFDGS